VVLVSESGIHEREQILHLHGFGIQVFLIGETLMRAADPGQKLKELAKW
jgi:indole-3-glycerol phosphate synthase